MRWGLVPQWARDEQIGNRLINARAETLRDKPAFRHLVAGGRCLVPASGYYEWQAQPGRKVPHYIHAADGHLLLFAALCDTWRSTAGEPLLSYTIITTTPADAIRHLHDRMPVILDRPAADAWLDCRGTPAEHAAALLRPATRPLAAHPVSTLVNNVRHDAPDCLAPAAAGPPELF
jgi:putative SOS response-associated peptidase YedK